MLHTYVDNPTTGSKETMETDSYTFRLYGLPDSNEFTTINNFNQEIVRWHLIRWPQVSDCEYSNKAGKYPYKVEVKMPIPEGWIGGKNSPFLYEIYKFLKDSIGYKNFKYFNSPNPYRIGFKKEEYRDLFLMVYNDFFTKDSRQKARLKKHINS